MKKLKIPRNLPRIFTAIALVFCGLAVALVANTTTAFAACGGTPTVVTDKEDYGALETVQITGSGFDCATTLYVKVTAPDGTSRSGDGTGADGPDVVTSDSNGAFTLNYALHGTLDGGSMYIGQDGTYHVEVMTSDGTVVASTTFTDSHLRAGQISWTRTPGTRAVSFTVLIAYRSGLTASSISVNFGEPGVSPASSSFSGSQISTGTDSTNAQYSIFRYTGSRTYQSDGPFTAYFFVCCRVGGLANPGSDFRIETIVDLRNNNNESPVSSSPAILQMVKGGVNNVPLTVSESINDTISCRMATTAESGIQAVASTLNHTLSVTSNCILQWNTSETLVGQKYAVQVVIEGNHQGRISSASQDFIIEIVDGTPPTCSPNGNSYTVQVGELFSTSITGSDPDNQQLTISHQGLPTGGTLTPSAGTSGPSPLTGTFSWTPTSANAGTNTAVTIVFADSSGLNTQCGFTILVPANQSPTAKDDDFSVVEDTTLSGNLLLDNGNGMDSDPEGDPLTVNIPQLSGPSNGSLTLNPDGSFSYTPALDFFGADSFTYRISDGNSFSPPATVAIQVTPVDDAPVAVDDVATVAEDDAATTIDVLANDTDVDGGTKTIAAVTQPANGTVVVAGDSWSVSYQPNANYCNNGSPTDDFTYTVNSGSTATVAVTVTCVDDAPVAVNDSATVAEDAAATTIDTLFNDTDADGGPKSISLVTQPAHGVVAITNGGADLTYTPAANYCNDGAPTDDFTYTLNGGSIATVAVTITCVNDAPVAHGQDVTTDEDTAVVIMRSSTDMEGDPISFHIVSGPAHGTLTGNTAPVTYAPEANYNGPDSFSFIVNDGNLDSAPAIVNITVNPVNDAPMAHARSVTTVQDTAQDITLTGSDVEGSTLTFTIVSNPTDGTLSGSGANQTYTPNANFHGTDSFIFTVSDGELTSSEAIVNITVAPVNDTPLADDQTQAVDEDTALPLILTGSDIDHDGLNFIIVSGPAHGRLNVGALPNVTYTPDANFNGADSFTFKVNDGSADSNVATVNITVNPVNDAPVAHDQSVPTDEDTALLITLTGSDMDGDSLTFTLVSGTTNGTLSGTGAAQTYTPNQDYVGADSFTFKVSDGTAESNVATVEIAVAMVNDAPVVTDQGATTDEDTPTVITLTGSDVDSDPLTYEILSGPDNGTLGSNGAEHTYTPDANFHGTDSFTFRATDGDLDSNVATVNITVNSVNDAPVADDQTVSTPEDTEIAITLTGNDVDGDSLSFSVVSGPTNGTLTGDLPNVTYKPNANYNGSDGFTFKVNDGTAESEATVSITVSPVNDAPVADGQTQAVDEDTALPLILTGSDIDGDALSFTIVTPPAHGSLNVDALPNVTYTPDANFNGADSFTFKVNDGSADSNVATVGITVNPLNDVPVANGQAVTTDEDTAKNIVLTGSDVEGSTLTFSVVANPTNGTLIESDDTWTYTPNANFHGTDSFTFTVSDGELTSSEATVNITVAPVNDAPVLGDIVADQVVAVNNSAKVYVTFTDLDPVDTHTAVWDWGDGTTSNGTVTESGGTGSVGTQAAPDSHVYTAPGVYIVKVNLDDGNGGTDSARFEYVVVYDPSGGFVTGGGWIDSPTGAYAADPTLTGKANFGFVSKYQKGANKPSGETQFQFKAGELNFHSSRYEWLVVAGANAKYKGEGTINGAGSYGFMLTATDGQANGGGGTDLFRIKIWDKNNGDAVVYDNQMGKGDDSSNGTVLGGGSIVVHDGKGAKAKASSLAEEAVDEVIQTSHFYLPSIRN